MNLPLYNKIIEFLKQHPLEDWSFTEDGIQSDENNIEFLDDGTIRFNEDVIVEGDSRQKTQIKRNIRDIKELKLWRILDGIDEE